MVVSVMVLSFLGLIVMAAVKVGDQFLGELLQAGGLEVFDGLMDMTGAFFVAGVFMVMFALAVNSGQFFLHMAAELFGLFLFALLKQFVDFPFGVFYKFLCNLNLSMVGVAVTVFPVFGDDFLGVAHQLVGFFFAAGFEKFLSFVLLLASPALEFIAFGMVTFCLFAFAVPLGRAFAISIPRFVALDTVAIAGFAFLAITFIVGG
jgi:hypothetical protein